MKYYFQFISSIIFVLLNFFACNSNQTSQPEVISPSFTATIAETFISPISIVSRSPESPVLTPTATPLPIPTATPLPSPTLTPTVISVTDAQAELALNVSNTWVYSATYYHRNIQTGDIITEEYTITDTVVSTQMLEPLFIAEIERDVSEVSPCLPDEECKSGQLFVMKRNLEGLGVQIEPLPVNFWFIIKKDKLFRQYQLDLSNLEEYQIEHLLPITEQKCGYPDRNEQDFFENEYKMCPNWGYTYIEGVINYHTAVGDFDNCFKVVRVDRGASRFQWICPRYGLIGEESQIVWQQGSEPYSVEYGYKLDLIKLLLGK